MLHPDCIFLALYCDFLGEDLRFELSVVSSISVCGHAGFRLLYNDSKRLLKVANEL